MSVSSHKLGPGQMSFGDAGSETEFGTQLRNGRVVPSYTAGETLDVLSGGSVTDEGEETWTVEGTILQSYDAESLLIWANENSGTEMSFRFTPVNSQALEVVGNVTITSLTVGGDVKARNTSDFSFTATDVVVGANI